MGSFETVRVGKGGRRVDVLISVSPIRDAAGRIIGASTIARDITERKRAQHLQRLAIAEERERIARELHDSVAQVLAFVSAKASAAEKLVLDGHLARAASGIQQLAWETRQAYDDVRDAILALRSSFALQNSLLDALREYLSHWQAQSGISVELNATPMDAFAPQLHPGAKLQVFRVVQEALTNLRKHSAASRVNVLLADTAGALEIVVVDDGIGFDPESIGHGGSPCFGLAMMSERAASLKGSLRIESVPGSGTRIVVRVPVERDP